MWTSSAPHTCCGIHASAPSVPHHVSKAFNNSSYRYKTLDHNGRDFFRQNTWFLSEKRSYQRSVDSRLRAGKREKEQPEDTVTTTSGDESSSNSSSRSLDEKRSGRSTYRPSSYTELVNDAAEAVMVGLTDGFSRMEVEFPAVSNVDGYKGSSDLYIDANIQLAIAAAKKISEDGKKIHILLPDSAEYQRSCKMFQSGLSLTENVTLGHLLEDREPAIPLLSKFLNQFDQSPDPAPAGAKADIYIALNASTVELVDLERYCNERAKNKPVILWNMELDTLRADLGLLGFPSKDMQYRFLSRFKPVFYIRQRDYSKTVSVAPFIINYSGALFREYPGPWQVMLRQDSGVYACVAEDANRRYGLGEFKAELTRAMGLDTEPEGSAMAFLRSGYKTSTWWEEAEEEEESNAWRT